VSGPSDDIGQGYRLLDEEELLAQSGWEEPARLEPRAHSRRRGGLRRALAKVLLGAGAGAVIGLLAAAGLRSLTRMPVEGVHAAGRASVMSFGAPPRTATGMSRAARLGEVRDQGAALGVHLVARQPASRRPEVSIPARDEAPVAGAAPAQFTPPPAAAETEFGFER
jgi:hypothetical protein